MRWNCSARLIFRLDCENSPSFALFVAPLCICYMVYKNEYCSRDLACILLVFLAGPIHPLYSHAAISCRLSTAINPKFTTLITSTNLLTAFLTIPGPLPPRLEYHHIVLVLSIDSPLT